MSGPAQLHRNRRIGAITAVLVLALTIAACQPVFGKSSNPITSKSSGPVFGEKSGPIRYGVLISESGLKYQFTGSASTVTAAAGSRFSDTNVREAFWHEGSGWYADQQDCTTWNSTAASVSPGPIQPGIALRIAPTGANNRGIKAITVTENIVYGAIWIFNVHIWDSTAAHAFTEIGHFDLSSIVGKLWVDGAGTTHSTMVPPPWHTCAVAIGRRFSFKLWTGDNPEPTWSDPTHVFTTVLPTGWDYPGYAGGYIGHLRAGTSATFTDQSTQPVCAVPGWWQGTFHCIVDLGNRNNGQSATTPPGPPLSLPHPILRLDSPRLAG